MAEPITTDDLTTGALDGTGVFDELMSSVNIHLQQEYNAQRIRGPEYSQVYLGGLQSVLQQSIQFLLTKEKAEKDTALVEVQTTLLLVQIDNGEKEGLILDQALVKTEQEIVNLVTQKELMDGEIAKTAQETINLISQELLTSAQAAQVAEETLKVIEEVLGITQTTANAVIQGNVLLAQECKLRAEFDLIQAQTIKSNAEMELLTQKTTTEKAQTTGVVIDPTSVVGKQNALYEAQTAGFQRDAEQKASKIMADTWNVRRTTDEGTEANEVNRFDNISIGNVIQKLMEGVDAQV